MTVLVLLVLCDRVWQESSEELTKMKGSETRVDIFYKQSYSWLQEGQQAILKHFTFVCLVCFCLLSWSFKNKKIIKCCKKIKNQMPKQKCHWH